MQDRITIAETGEDIVVDRVEHFVIHSDDVLEDMSVEYQLRYALTLIESASSEPEIVQIATDALSSGLDD